LCVLSLFAIESFDAMHVEDVRFIALRACTLSGKRTALADRLYDDPAIELGAVVEMILGESVALARLPLESPPLITRQKLQALIHPTTLFPKATASWCVRQNRGTINFALGEMFFSLHHKFLYATAIANYRSGDAQTVAPFRHILIAESSSIIL
jgi:hypothetical protein